jgi:hypothetical protein
VIKNYVKQGDEVTFTLDPQSKQLQSLRGASYLNDPKDAVTISAKLRSCLTAPSVSPAP